MRISAKKIFKKLSPSNSNSENQSVLVRGATSAFAIKIVGVFFAFILQIVLARLLGVNDFGLYTYVLTLINMGCMIGKLGMDTAGVRFVASYNVNEKWSLLKAYVFMSDRTVFFLSSFLSVVVYIGGVYFGLIQDRSLQKILPVALILLPVSSLVLNLNAHLRGLKCIVCSQVATEILRPIMTLIIVGAFLIACLKINVEKILIAYFLSTMLVLIYLKITFNRQVSHEYHASTPNYKNKLWLKTAIPLLCVACFNFILSQADILFLGSLCDSSDVGIYAPAKRIGTFITIVLTSVNTIAAPMFSEQYSKNNMSELQDVVSLAAKWILYLSLPCCIFAIVFAKPLLAIFGEAFIPGFRVLQIIALGQLVNALAGSVGFLMIMTGHQNIVACVLGLSAFSNIILNMFLIPKYGIIGAATATFITTVLWNSSMLFFTLKYVGINPTFFRWRKWL